MPSAPDDSASAMVARTRAVDALDSDATLVALGETDNGYLWRYLGEVDDLPEPTPNPFWLAALAIVFGVVAITALPTGRRSRPAAQRTDDENPADTFEEDDSA